MKKKRKEGKHYQHHYLLAFKSFGGQNRHCVVSISFFGRKNVKWMQSECRCLSEWIDRELRQGKLIQPQPAVKKMWIYSHLRRRENFFHLQGMTVICNLTHSTGPVCVWVGVCLCVCVILVCDLTSFNPAEVLRGCLRVLKGLEGD